eukprot:g8054.t1
MSLYSPKTHPDAIPLKNYPPTWTAHYNGAASVLHVASHSLIFYLLPPRPSLCPDPPWASYFPSFFPSMPFLHFLNPSLLLFHYLSLVVSGYLYVSAITLRRPDYFSSRYMNNFQFWLLLCFSTLLYYTGPQACLQLLPFCPPSGHFPAYHGRSSALWEFLCYLLLPYHLGLQFTYLDNVRLLQSLGCKVPIPSRWTQLTRQELVVVFVTTLVVCGLVWHHVQLISFNPFYLEQFYTLLTCYAVFFLAVLMLAWRRKKSHNLHFHHYLLGLLPTPLFRFPAPLTLCCLGVALGVWVEGVACWGLDPIFVRTRTVKYRGTARCASFGRLPLTTLGKSANGTYYAAGPFRVFKLEITAIQDEMESCLQLSSLRLYHNQNNLITSYPKGTVTASNPGGRSPVHETPEKCLEENTNSKFLDLNMGWHSRTELLVEFPSPVQIDAYEIFTANDFPGRDPLSWRLLASTIPSGGPTGSFQLLDQRKSAVIEKTCARALYTFSLTDFLSMHSGGL